MAAGAALAALSLRAGVAGACSPPVPPLAQPVAPPAGKTDVSPASSIMVVQSYPPHELTLAANGVAVDLPAPEQRGPFFPTGGFLYAYQLPQLLEPDTDYVLSGPDPSVFPPDPEQIVELLHFRTASSYDEQPGTAPVITLFKLWRVRYPLDLIGAGSCVFSEYQGYLQLRFDPASVPDTAPSDILYQLVIQPSTGGSTSVIEFRADHPYVGYDHSKDSLPLSPTGEWPLELDPTREYCVTLEAQGDGDIARPALASQQVCAKIVQLSAPGAPPPPTPSSSGGGGSGFWSCSASGDRRSGSGLPWLALLGVGVGLCRRERAASWWARARRRRALGTTRRAQRSEHGAP